jgi:hypothetical protein
MINLIYGITVCDEHEEIIRLLNLLKNNTKDEIVVQYDLTKTPQSLLDDIKKYDVKIFEQPFNGDFSKFKNELNLTCQILGADYIFQLDADELLSETLIKSVKSMVYRNSECELFYLPRINTVQGITEEHVKMWGWSINEKGYINFPDNQGRIFRSHLRWGGKVHESIVGMKNYMFFPIKEEYCIIHNKTIEKQEKQNTLYSGL